MPSPKFRGHGIKVHMVPEELRMNEELKNAINTVLEQCPDASEDDIKNEFERYERDFLIPPKDALRSVLRKFSSGDIKISTQNTTRELKKVEGFNSLSGEDKNIEIEVKVISFNPWSREIRGQQRQMGYGMIEEDPWGKSNSRERWKYTDWGNHSETMKPGSIIRIEGASVNEYEGKLSLNINQSSRIVVLQESNESIPTLDEPINISEINNLDGVVTLIGRVVSKNKNTIERKDGSGTLDMVKGQIADSTGKIGFVSWVDFNHDIGDLIKIEKSQIKRFRETPELNIGQYTKVESFRDSKFPSLEDLNSSSKQNIASLRDGMREIDITIEIKKWIKREFTNDEGDKKTVWSGEIIDPTGKCRMTSWQDLEIEEKDLPIWLSLDKVRVRSWQGIPDITIDNLEQIKKHDEAVWESIEDSNEFNSVTNEEIVNGGSRANIETQGVIISIRNDSGIIWRDGNRRVLREDDDRTDAVKDLRIRMIMDDGENCISVIMNRQSSEKFIQKSMEELSEELNKTNKASFIKELRTKLLGFTVNLKGRSIVDQQGAMFLAEELEVEEKDPKSYAMEIKTKWGI
jgi:ssDNA-binding replication factor A large subunit